MRISVNRRRLLGAAAGLAATRAVAQGPQPTRMPRIGILALRTPGDANPATAALYEGLRERGYVDGRSAVVDYPDVKGREDRLPAAAADLVGRRPDVILIVGPAPLEVARRATKSIPLVMVAASADPVAEGIAASLARPGGNVTGLTYAEPDRFKKQLELLKAAVPHVRRVAVLWDFDIAVFRRSWEAPLAEAGRVLGMSVLEPARVRTAEDLPAAFDQVKQQQADALIVVAGGTNMAARKQVADLALRHRLPGIAAFTALAQAGLLMSYGPDLADINRRAGGFVDKILKGGNPASLAIELPSKFDLAVNFATARALGLAIPQSLEMRITARYP